MFGWQKENEANLIRSGFLFLLAKYYDNESNTFTINLFVEPAFCVISTRSNAC